MCAINGCSWEDQELVRSMNAVTKHRGPDGTQIVSFPAVTLGHNRLSIIDLDARASQPMQTADGRYTIVFNGEIYNYRELKRELSQFPYRTESDTEVILAGYSVWGKAVFQKLDGMFALALYDAKENVLVLARDPMGIKPLYYQWKDQKLVFSSELTGVLTYVRQPRINVDALTLFFDLMYVPGPHTLVRDICKLPPSTYALFKDGVFTITPYVTDIVHESESSLVSTISRAVGRQLISDRPVGVFLSGGLDSSIVLHHTKEHAGRADTFTVGYETPSSESNQSSSNFDEKFNSDLYLAKKTAEHYGSRHHEYRISSKDIEENLIPILEAIDEPIGNPTIIPTYLLSRFAREHVVVTLDGSGGDELFGGYPWYKITALRTMMPGWFFSALAPFHWKLSKMSTPLDEHWYHAFMAGASKVRPRILREAFSKPYTGDIHSAHDEDDPTLRHIRESFFTGEVGNFVQHCMDIDTRMWLVDESLMRSDKMSMAHGLEMRVPLLDLEIASYAQHMSIHDKVSWRENKIALKSAYKDVLPAHLFNQPKRGWFTPGAKWLREDTVMEQIRSILSASYNEATRDVFDWEYIKNTLIEGHLTRRGYHSKTLWGLVMFQVWAKKHKVTFQ